MAIATWNGLWGPSLGAELDAANFHQMAEGFADGTRDLTIVIGWVYSYALGFVYKLTGPNLLIGSLVSCAAWLASAVALKACLDELPVSPIGQLLVFAVYCLLPSALAYTSITMREPFQLLAMNVMALAVVKLFAGRSMAWCLLLIAAGVVAGLLHGALIVIGIVIATTVAAWILILGARSASFLASRAIAVLGLMMFVSYSVFMYITYSYGVDTGAANVLAAAEGLQEKLSVLGGRTDYRQFVPPLDSALVRVVVGLFQYLLEPLPWRVKTGLDAIIVAENLVRLALLLLALRSLVVARGRARLTVTFLILVYGCLEGMWSLGTSTWGTAARHHIPVMGILLLAAAAGFPNNHNKRSLACG